MALEPGTRFGSYEVVEAIGAGGMGEVYRAYDISPDGERFVMIKPAEISSVVPKIIIVENWTGELERLVPTD